MIARCVFPCSQRCRHRDPPYLKSGWVSRCALARRYQAGRSGPMFQLCSGTPSLLGSSLPGDDLHIPTAQGSLALLQLSPQQALGTRHPCGPWKEPSGSWFLMGTMRLVEPPRGCPCRDVTWVHTSCLTPGLLPVVHSLW